MTVGELIEVLAKIDPLLPVRIIADHGQVPMALTGVQYSYIEEDSYMPEEMSQEDYEKFGVGIKVLMLEGF